MIQPGLETVLLQLPSESDWVPGTKLRNLLDLEAVMKGSGGKEAVRLIQELGNIKFEWPEHEARYKRLRKEWYRDVVGF